MTTADFDSLIASAIDKGEAVKAAKRAPKASKRKHPPIRKVVQSYADVNPDGHWETCARYTMEVLGFAAELVNHPQFIMALSVGQRVAQFSKKAFDNK